MLNSTTRHKDNVKDQVEWWFTFQAYRTHDGPDGGGVEGVGGCQQKFQKYPLAKIFIFYFLTNVLLNIK